MAERAKNKFYVKRAVIHGAKIWFAAENKFFGPGAARFLALVEKMGTINEACDEMKLSYNKARKIVRTMERELGSKVFTINRSYENWKGSTGTGGAIMTDEWKELVRRYEAMKAECDAFVNESYERHFGGFFEPLATAAASAEASIPKTRHKNAYARGKPRTEQTNSRSRGKN